MSEKKEWLRRTGVFAYGAAGYASLEILARGRTHWSMALAGGCCLLLIDRVGKTEQRLLRKAALCAVGISAVEFCFGAVFNLWLGKNIWNYSTQPGNLLGQVCPAFTLLWGVLSLPVLAYFAKS